MEEFMSPIPEFNPAEFQGFGIPEEFQEVIAGYREDAATGLESAIDSFSSGESTETGEESTELPIFSTFTPVEGEEMGQNFPEQFSGAFADQQPLIQAGIENIPLDENASTTDTTNGSGIVFNYQDGEVVGQIGNEQVIAFNIPQVVPFDIGSFLG